MNRNQIKKASSHSIIPKLLGYSLLVTLIFEMGISNVMASTLSLGTAISGSSSTGSTIYNNTVQSYNNGLLLSAPATTMTNTVYQDETRLTGTLRAFDYTANSFAALGVTGGVGAGSDSFILGSGAVVNAVTLGTQAYGQYSPTNATYTYSEAMYQYTRQMAFGAGLELGFSSDEHQQGSSSGTASFTTQVGNALGQSHSYGNIGQVSTYTCTVDLSSYTCYNAPNASSYTGLVPTSGVDVGPDVMFLGSGYETLTVDKAGFIDTYVSTQWYGPNNQPGGSNDTTVTYGTASAATTYAVNTSGSLTLNGGNIINGATQAGSGGGGVYILGNGNYLNGNVGSGGGTNITFTDTGSVTISDGSTVTGNVDFAGNDGTFILGAGSNVTGNINNSVATTGTLVFENSSVVTGSVGSTYAL